MFSFWFPSPERATQFHLVENPVEPGGRACFSFWHLRIPGFPLPEKGAAREQRETRVIMNEQSLLSPLDFPVLLSVLSWPLGGARVGCPTRQGDSLCPICQPPTPSSSQAVLPCTAVPDRICIP